MPCAPTRAPVTCLHPFPEPSHIPTFSTRPQVRELRRLARDKERRGAVDKAVGFNVQEEVVDGWGGWGGGSLGGCMCDAHRDRLVYVVCFQHLSNVQCKVVCEVRVF